MDVLQNHIFDHMQRVNVKSQYLLFVILDFFLFMNFWATKIGIFL